MIVTTCIRVHHPMTPDSGQPSNGLPEEDGDNMRGGPVHKHCDMIGCAVAGNLKLRLLPLTGNDVKTVYR